MNTIQQMPDMARARREHMRWLIILTLNNARPIGAAEALILTVAQAIYPDATPLELRRDLLRSVADSVRRMHAGGVNHRDCYLCHYLTPRDGKKFGKTVYVIDLHRAQLRRRVPRRYLVKDLAGLCFSSFGANLSKREALRFVRL